MLFSVIFQFPTFYFGFTVKIKKLWSKIEILNHAWARWKIGGRGSNSKAWEEGNSAIQLKKIWRAEIRFPSDILTAEQKKPYFFISKTFFQFPHDFKQFSKNDQTLVWSLRRSDTGSSFQWEREGEVPVPNPPSPNAHAWIEYNKNSAIFISISLDPLVIWKKKSFIYLDQWWRSDPVYILGKIQC